VTGVQTCALPISPVSFPFDASVIPEQLKQRPLACGLQVQNFDYDDRQRQVGQLDPDKINIGALGCFVRLANGTIAILSNNHVLAGGDNRPVDGSNRILQHGSLTFKPGQHIATLTDFVPLQPSPEDARPSKEDVIYNDMDAAIAVLQNDVRFTNGYLPMRTLPIPFGTEQAKVGDQVFKVGPATGVTYGSITAVRQVVGPVRLPCGPCWFRGQFEITGSNGLLFSDHGDSGSAVVSTTGEVIGLITARLEIYSYACPIQAVLTAPALRCTLA